MQLFVQHKEYDEKLKFQLNLFLIAFYLEFSFLLATWLCLQILVLQMIFVYLYSYMLHYHIHGQGDPLAVLLARLEYAVDKRRHL